MKARNEKHSETLSYEHCTHEYFVTTVTCVRLKQAWIVTTVIGFGLMRLHQSLMDYGKLMRTREGCVIFFDGVTLRSYLQTSEYSLQLCS